MRFDPPLIEGRLVRRYKRFLADVTIPGRGTVVAHCANPGAMTTCAEEGGRVWLSRHDDPKRKLAYTWQIAQVGRSYVCVNSALGNRLVAEALERGVIAELSGYDALRREVRVDGGRLDFALDFGRRSCFVEVKTATLAVSPTVSAFPDAVTKRGSRHVKELMRLKQCGHRAVLLFCCARSQMRVVRPADEIDPAYGEVLRRAAGSGVEVYAYGCRVTPREVTVARRLRVSL